jgi:hypothetical protein
MVEAKEGRGEGSDGGGGREGAHWTRSVRGTR